MANVASNVLQFPQIGLHINTADQGVYLAKNETTGTVERIYRLDFDSEWYLHALQPLNSDIFAWHLMAEHANDPFESMTRQEVSFYFSQAYFAAFDGAWQALFNSNYCVAKFTPADLSSACEFAIMPFKDMIMGKPVMLTKVEDDLDIVLESAKQQLHAMAVV